MGRWIDISWVPKPRVRKRGGGEHVRTISERGQATDGSIGASQL